MVSGHGEGFFLYPFSRRYIVSRLGHGKESHLRSRGDARTATRLQKNKGLVWRVRNRGHTPRLRAPTRFRSDVTSGWKRESEAPRVDSGGFSFHVLHVACTTLRHKTHKRLGRSLGNKLGSSWQVHDRSPFMGQFRTGARQTINGPATLRRIPFLQSLDVLV